MKNFLQLLVLVMLSDILLNCAGSTNMPTGGPKDITPPKVVETHPQNGSAGFNTNKFYIKFNEFVSLKDIQSQALISPPMEKLPDFTIKGKSVNVKFNEELKANTTYSVYFGDAIVDITEQNPLLNYTYIFSTGDFVDSLSLSGHIINALDLQPVEAAYVMLYKDNNDTITLDSLPYFVPPYYLSRTDAKGRFQFDGLFDDKFLLFAIMDQNSNLVFDQPGEQIAFLDSLVSPVYFKKLAVDTVAKDSLYDVSIDADSVLAVADSLRRDSLENENDMGIKLYMFLSPDTVQRILKAEVIEKNVVRFSFALPATNVNFEFVKYPLEDNMFVEDFSVSKDTIYWYINNPPNDSLELLVTQFDDTLGTVYLNLNPNNKVKNKRKKKKKDSNIISWESNLTNNSLLLNQHLEIIFSQPYVKFNDLDSSLLVAGNDSIWDPEFKFSDSLKMKIVFPFDLTEDTRYRIYFPDSSFTNWNNQHSKAIDINFSVHNLSDYGILTLNLMPEIKQNYILQLINEKGNTVNEFLFKNDTTITIEYLNPQKYTAKIIFDNDKNNKWSTGNYGLLVQPEKVIFFPKEIKIRANWEVQDDWIW